MTKGSIMNGLNMGIIKSMPIPVPEMDRQLAYAECLGRVERLTALADTALDRSSALFASLQSRAFRGEL